MSKSLRDYAYDVSYYLLSNFEDELAENDVDTILQKISENDSKGTLYKELQDVFDGQLGWSYILIYLMWYFRSSVHYEINLSKYGSHQTECNLNFTPQGSTSTYGSKSNLELEIDNLNFIIKKENLKGCDLVYINSSEGLSEIYLDEGVQYCCCQNCTNLKHVELPSTVEYVNFSDCTNLNKIILPRSIKELTYGCFMGCSSLDTVIYEGSKNDWMELEKGWYWRAHSKITEIKCSDGVIKLRLKSK